MYRVILNTMTFDENTNKFLEDKSCLLASFETIDDALNYIGKDLTKLDFYLNGCDLVISYLEKN